MMLYNMEICGWCGEYYITAVDTNQGKHYYCGYGEFSTDFRKVYVFPRISKAVGAMEHLEALGIAMWEKMRTLEVDNIQVQMPPCAQEDYLVMITALDESGELLYWDEDTFISKPRIVNKERIIETINTILRRAHVSWREEE
jgi:hypothetical protein